MIVGKEGVSRTFMVGSAHVPDPAQAQEEFDSLRRNLLADPYFSGVPSMDLRSGKTALQFHAKDDLPEVRREVFRVISGLNITASVAVRRKTVLATQAKTMFQAGQKMGPDSIYDDLVGKLFWLSRLNPQETRITFDRRGKSLRHQALSDAIDHAWNQVADHYNPNAVSNISPLVESDYPTAHAGLQIANYSLWAVQRLYERSEDRN